MPNLANIIGNRSLHSPVKTRHDANKIVVTSKIRHYVTKRQTYVMTSNIRHDIKDTSLRQKVRHDFKTRHDAKKFVMTSKSRDFVPQKYVKSMS